MARTADVAVAQLTGALAAPFGEVTAASGLRVAS
jgi:hypothetical protein